MSVIKKECDCFMLLHSFWVPLAAHVSNGCKSCIDIMIIELFFYICYNRHRLYNMSMDNVMARPKKNKIQLSNADIKKLQAILKKKDTSRTMPAARSMDAWRPVLLRLPVPLFRKATAAGRCGFLKNRQRLDLRNLSAGKRSEGH